MARRLELACKQENPVAKTLISPARLATVPGASSINQFLFGDREIGPWHCIFASRFEAALIANSYWKQLHLH